MNISCSAQFCDVESKIIWDSSQFLTKCLYFITILFKLLLFYLLPYLYIQYQISHTFDITPTDWCKVLPAVPRSMMYLGGTTCFPYFSHIPPTAVANCLYHIHRSPRNLEFPSLVTTSHCSVPFLSDVASQSKSDIASWHVNNYKVR